MRGLLGDLRFALRRVAGSPGLTLLIVATFALGIGANTAVFSLFDQVLLRSMPVKDPGSLVLIHTPGPNSGSFESNKDFPAPISYPMFTDFRDKTDVFEGVLAYFPTSVFFGVDGNTERIQADARFRDVLRRPRPTARHWTGLLAGPTMSRPAVIRWSCSRTVSGRGVSGRTPPSWARRCESTPRACR